MKSSRINDLALQKLVYTTFSDSSLSVRGFACSGKTFSKNSDHRIETEALGPVLQAKWLAEISEGNSNKARFLTRRPAKTSHKDG